MFLSPNSVSVSPLLLTKSHANKLYIEIWKCSESEENGLVSILQQSGRFGLHIIQPFYDDQSGIKIIKVGIGTNPGGFQLLPLTDTGNGSTAYFRLSLQHKTVAYATSIVVNNAGLQMVHSSEPLIIDWTPPVVENIVVVVTQPHKDSFFVEAAWDVSDDESEVTGCFWKIGNAYSY